MITEGDHTQNFTGVILQIKWSDKVSNAEMRRRCFQENIMEESGDSLDTFSERTVHSSAGQGSFGRPKASAKQDAPGLHGVEHQRRSWKIWSCPGQSSGSRPKIDGAGEQLQRPYVPDATIKTDNDDECSRC